MSFTLLMALILGLAFLVTLVALEFMLRTRNGMPHGYRHGQLGIAVWLVYFLVIIDAGALLVLWLYSINP